MKKTNKEQNEEEIIPLPQETAIAPVEEKPEEPVKEKETDQRPRQSFSQVLRNILLAVLRLMLLVAVIGGIGAAIYFGVPLVYEQYIRPVKENTSQLNDLNIRQNQSETQIADLQARLSTLEADQTTQGNSLTDIGSRVQTLEGADVQRNESLIELTYQSDLIRAMELLSRARLFLYQSNFGLARSDIQAARNVLAELQSIAPESKQTDLKEALFRLDLAIQNLPDFPVAASDDLDIAWQILMDGYPVTSTLAPTPTPSTNTEGTPTPGVEITSTPTIVP